MSIRLPFTSSQVLSILLLTAVFSQTSFGEKAPVYKLAKGGVVKEWVVLGPFPNPHPDTPQPGGNYRLGFHRDFLTDLGGESRAVLEPGAKVSYKNLDGVEKTVVAQAIEANPLGQVNLVEKFKANLRVAYAFCWIESEKDQTGYALFGSNDGAKVWVGKNLVHTAWTEEGRASVPGDELIKVDLKKGLNPVLVKVEDGGGSAWEFIIEVYDKKGMEIREKAKTLLGDLRAFQKAQLVPTEGGFLLDSPVLPNIDWEDPDRIEMQLGPFDLHAQWFGPDLKEVSEADLPGAYVASVTATLPDGSPLRRALSFYRVPKGWTPPSNEMNAYIKTLPVAKEFKKRYRKTLDAISEDGGAVEAHAIFLQAFETSRTLDRPLGFTDTPEIVHDDFHLALKRNLIGIDARGGLRPLLNLPKEEIAPVLRKGTPAEAAMTEGFAKDLRAVCEEWAEESGEPFSVLIARRGTITFHESFGEPKIDAPRWWASVSKLIAGLLFAQFVEEGLIGIDDPVGKYLPDFPTEGDQTITLRHCFTHATGLEGHGEWGGPRNPWLDNSILNGLPSLQPGRIHKYNGMGYDLAGKVMEVVAGKSVGRLMRERLFDPLGMRNTTMDDLAYDTYSDTADMAILAQMLLNRGAYGNTRFFSEATYDKLLPVRLNEFYPGLTQEWGIGVLPMREPDRENPDKEWILSENTVGHGAASGAIFRVDPDNELVVIQTRDEGGHAYTEYVPRFLRVIEEGIKKD